MRKLLGRITLGVVLLAVLGLAWFWLLSPYRTFVIYTGSMGDVIPSRSAVVVHEDHYQVGQVVTFVANGGIVTHRLLDIDSDGNITTKGDANAAEDPFHVPEENIIGGVVAAPQELGLVFEMLKTPSFVVPVAAFVVGVWLMFSPGKRSADGTTVPIAV